MTEGPETSKFRKRKQIETKLEQELDQMMQEKMKKIEVPPKGKSPHSVMDRGLKRRGGIELRSIQGKKPLVKQHFST